MERNTQSIDAWDVWLDNAAMWEYEHSPKKMPQNKLNPMKDGGPQRIPVTELQTGMTVWERNRDHWEQGPTLGRYFLTSLRFPTITFERKNGGPILEWHPCGHVYVTV